MQHVDLIVVGAGPAGSAAALGALRARPDARVVLLDRAKFPRDKACGDGIPPHALAELARLGVTGIDEGYPPVRLLGLDAPEGDRVVGRSREPVRVIPRSVFDARLVDAAVQAGAELRTHRVRRVEVTDTAVSVDGAFSAPHLVAADGANSTVRRALGIPTNPPEHRAIAVRGYAAAPPGEPELRVTFMEHWPSYAWSFPIGDGSANVGYGLRVSEFRGGRAELHDTLAATLPAQPARPGSLRAHPLPLSTHRPAPAVGRVLLAGDAGSLINPLTGEGIFYAIVSGRLAGYAAMRRPDRAGRFYRRLLRRRFERHFQQTRLLSRLMEFDTFRAATIAAARDERVFQDMVEVALGDGVASLRSTRIVLGAWVRAARAGARTGAAAA